MSMTVWNPWDDMLSLREAMNRLLEDSYVRPLPGGTRSNLALDVFEDADDIEVTATLPGMADLYLCGIPGRASAGRPYTSRVGPTHISDFASALFGKRRVLSDGAAAVL